VFIISCGILLVITLVYRELRRRAGSSMEVHAVTLVSLLVFMVATVNIFLRLYTVWRSPRIIIVHLIQLAILAYFTILAIHAVRGKALFKLVRAIAVAIFLSLAIAFIILYWW